VRRVREAAEMKILRATLALLELAGWKFLTFRLHRAAPFWSKAVIRMNHLERILR
jgi:hypothetical protein